LALKGHVGNQSRTLPNLTLASLPRAVD